MTSEETGPIDVLLALSSLRGGGAERVASVLANAWCARGFTVVVVTTAGAGGDAYALDPDVRRVALDLEGEARGLASAIGANISRSRALRAVIRRFRPRVVLGFNTTANVLVAVAAKGLGARVVLAERNWPPRSVSGRAWVTLRRHLYGLADAVVAQTEDGAKWLREHTRAREVVVIPNPLRWPPVAGEPRVEPASVVPARAPLLLAVGNLAYQKGHDLLLEAFARVADEHPDWHLAIVGAGKREALLEQVGRLGLAGRAHLVGRVGNVDAWYERAELFVLSSRFEGFPNVLLEAMGAGLAVISFDCPTGPRDIVRNGHDGVLTSAEDVLSLSANIAALMSAPGERARLGGEAVSVRERFALERVLADWDRVLGTSASGGF